MGIQFTSEVSYFQVKLVNKATIGDRKECFQSIEKKILLRCKRMKGKCKAKARVKFLREYALLDDLEANADIILNPDNWELVELLSPPHTCNCPVEPIYSEGEFRKTIRILEAGNK